VSKLRPNGTCGPGQSFNPFPFQMGLIDATPGFAWADEKPGLGNSPSRWNFRRFFSPCDP
jgi:hypothetical protein